MSDTIKIPEAYIKLENGTVTKDGRFLVREKSGEMHVGWWCEFNNRWTCEISEAGYDVGELEVLAKIETLVLK